MHESTAVNLQSSDIGLGLPQRARDYALSSNATQQLKQSSGEVPPPMDNREQAAKEASNAAILAMLLCMAFIAGVVFLTGEYAQSVFRTAASEPQCVTAVVLGDGSTTIALHRSDRSSCSP